MTEPAAPYIASPPKVENPVRLAMMLSLSAIVESPTNPRRTYDQAKDDELAESVSTLGVLQPVLVRPLEEDGAYELVFGHRRLRAARKVGLDAIPAFVRELSDLEVLEAQLVENTQRADVEPLEEARAYKRLHVDYGRAVDEIAAKVSKSRAHVYGRLKLLELCAAGQKAIEIGALEATVGLLVARIPSEKLQREALGRLRGYNGDPVSYRRAIEVIQHEFMLRLKDAPFARGDTDLVPAAGPCTTCPKRTGNQVELFADVKSADICTDPPCYQKKVDAAWKLRAAAARASGHEVLEGKAAAKAASYGGDYVRLNETCYEDGKSRTYQKLLGKDAPPTTLARTEHGDVYELVRKADVKKVLREKGIVEKKDVSYRTGRSPAAEQKRTLQLRTSRAAIEQVVARARELEAAGCWPFLAMSIARASLHDTLKTACARRGWTPEKKTEGLGEVVARHLAEASTDLCREVAIELLISRYPVGFDGGYGESLTFAADTLGIDLKHLELEQKAEFDAAAKVKKEKIKARAKKKDDPKSADKKRKAKVQTCRSCGCTDDDCSGCIEATGEPCTWVERDLCSACAGDV